MKSNPRKKLAVITGGGSGIGLALAHAFIRSGYAIVISGRDKERLRRGVQELKAGNETPSVDAIPCDVRDPASVNRFFATIRKRFSAIDVLINNAGVAHGLAPVAKLDSEVWKRVIETNLTGTFLVTRAALPMMHAGATIVNNLSIAAVQTFSGMSAYNASKAGGLGFTNALREELREQGIRVLALMPGATDTEIWRQFWPDAPREKMISPETVAAAVLHAVSAPAVAAVEEIRIGPAAGGL
ncbi:MAG TPA: SDR family oxidoreductase [Candidatus Angelobacter sp.]|nr:SDR family oxidoreductase [Candidatus Angelobacter sp.]